jgi:hypothetical protein
VIARTIVVRPIGFLRTAFTDTPEISQGECFSRALEVAVSPEEIALSIVAEIVSP